MKLSRLTPAQARSAIVIILIAGYFLFEQLFTYTSNAYVASNVVVVSPQVSGHIRTIDVKRNQHVTIDQGNRPRTIRGLSQ